MLGTTRADEGAQAVTGGAEELAPNPIMIQWIGSYRIWRGCGREALEIRDSLRYMISRFWIVMDAWVTLRAGLMKR